jgi:hypothetical protein
MAVIFGPVLLREGGYAFDARTPEQGLSRGCVYRRIEDAYYARKAEIQSPVKDMPVASWPAAPSMNLRERRPELPCSRWECVQKNLEKFRSGSWRPRPGQSDICCRRMSHRSVRRRTALRWRAD